MSRNYYEDACNFYKQNSNKNRNPYISKQKIKEIENPRYKNFQESCGEDDYDNGAEIDSFDKTFKEPKSNETPIIDATKFYSGKSDIIKLDLHN